MLLPLCMTKCTHFFTPSYNSSSLSSFVRPAPGNTVIICMKQCKKNKIEREGKKERLGFICKFLRIAITVSCWNTHKLTSDLTDHWAFLQHYTYWCLENTLYIQKKRQKLLKRWKLNIHTGAGHVSKKLFPRTSGINKKGFATGTLPLTGKTSCLSNGEISLFKESMMPAKTLMSHSASH